MKALSRRLAVLLGLLLAGALLLITRAPWLHAAVPDLAGGTTAVDVAGSQAAPLAAAAGLVALASAAVTSLSSRVVRLLSGPLLVIAGIAGAAAAIGVRMDPAAHAASAISGTTGVSGSGAEVGVTSWPLVAVAPALGLVVLGLGILVAGRAWVRTARYQRDASTTSPRSDPREDPSAAWDALSRGEDPTGTSHR